MKKEQFEVAGMGCMNCSKTIQNACQILMVYLKPRSILPIKQQMLHMMILLFQKLACKQL